MKQGNYKNLPHSVCNAIEVAIACGDKRKSWIYEIIEARTGLKVGIDFSKADVRDYLQH